MNMRVGQLGALGQEGRLQIFRLLVHAGPDGNCVDEIKRRLKMPGSTLSHHLDALTRSGLLTARRSGRFIYHAVNWREASGLIRFLIEDCCAEMNLGGDNISLSLSDLERCADAKSRARAERRNRRETETGEGNGRPKYQGTGQRALRP